MLGAIAPGPDDTVVTLGDYVDRGPDTKGVLDQLIELRKHCRLIPILGNHEELMLAAYLGGSEFDRWLQCGGRAALDSYGKGRTLDRVPRIHVEFLKSCVDYYETETHFFVHANYRPNFRLDEENGYVRRWEPLDKQQGVAPHYSRKTAVLGHTPQSEVLDLGHLICIDTGCCDGGWLTGLEVTSGQLWQVDQFGNLRDRSAMENGHRKLA